MPTPVQWPPIGGATFQIPTSGETNWPVLTNFLVALGSAQGTAAQKVGVRVATTTPVTVSSTNDAVVGIDLAVAGASVVNLPAGVTGQWLCIVDRKGDAGTNGITLTPNGAETIAGQATLTLNQDGASLIMAFDGTGNWMIIAQAAGEGAGGGISRAAIDAATANWVVINSGTGMLSQEQYLNAVRGGLGVNASAFTGFLKFTAGAASAAALVAADIPSGINANKIFDGTISNTQFERLSGVTGNIQAQLDAKQTADADLTAIAALSGTGWAVRTATDTWATRTFTAASSKVSITNPSGLAGDPAFDVVEANLNHANIGGIVPLTKGGTGEITAQASLTALLPTQAGQAGKLLYTNGTLASWLATSSFIPVTTKGDLFGFASASARIPVGSNGQVLTADSTNANGVAWATPTSGLTLSRKSSSFTAAPGFLYELDTTSGPITVTLPTWANGGFFQIIDGSRNFATNNCILTPATGEAIRGLATNASKTLSANGDGIIMVGDASGGYWAYNQTGGGAGSTGGSGSGEKNYLSASANSSAGWAVSGAGIAVSTETTASNFPDNVTQTSAIKFLRASGSDYAYARFTLDQVDYNKTLKIIPDIKYAGTAGDYTIRVFSNTASNYGGTSTELTVSPSTSVPATTTQLGMSFTSAGSSAPYIEVRVYGVAGTTALYMNNFLVGPGILGNVPAGGFLGTLTTAVTSNLGTISNVSIDYDRVYRRLRASGTIQVGTVGASAATLDLPFGLTSGIVSSPAAGTKIVGKWWREILSANQRKQGTLWIQSGSTSLRFGNDDYTNGGFPDSATAGTGLFTNNEVIFFEYDLPISNWADSATSLPGAVVEYASNSNATNTATDTTSFAYGAAGSLIPNGGTGTNYIRTARLTTPYQMGDVLDIQVDQATGSWVEIDKRLGPLLVQSSFGYGVRLIPTVGSTDVTVQFLSGGAVASGLTFNSAGDPWSGLSTWRWRLRKTAASAPVGIALANSNDAGSVRPRKGQYDLNVTSTGWASSRCKGLYYQDQDGNHRLKFNIVGAFSGQANNNFVQVSISGITTVGFVQAISAYNGNAQTVGVSNAVANASTSTISGFIGAVVSINTTWAWSGDIELASKPTWA